MKTTRSRLLRLAPSLLYAAAVAVLLVDTAQAGYPETVLSNSPVAYYRLEELAGATVAVDSSPNHFDGTYVQNLDGTSPVLGAPGLAVNSMTVNGGTTSDNGYVAIPYHPELNPLMPDNLHGAPFSVECWVHPTAISSDPNGYSIPLSMFGSYSDPNPPYNNANGWNIYQSPGPTARWIFNLKTVGFFSSADSGVAVELLKWTHLAFTFDGAAGFFYVNGAAVSSAGGITGYFANPTHDGQIGAGANVGFLPFNGSVDEVAFYTNALAAADILTHYQVGTNSIRAPNVAAFFLQQPVSATNFHGTTATFSSLAGGNPPPAYQWFRGASPIPNATNSSYALTAFYPADNNATFHVTASNSVGGATSDVVTLTVLTNLDITSQPFGPITRNAGGKAAFRLVAVGAQPISYQWSKVAGGATNSIPGATNDTLWLSNVQLADNLSEYFALLTGPFGSVDSSTAQLLVQARPVTVPVTEYARGVIADDPVAYWRLDENGASGVATDAVGSFDGAYVAGAGAFTFQTPGGVPQSTNTALRLTDGATVQIPYALELNPVSGPWSVEAWINPAIQPGDFATVMSSMYVVPGSISGWNLYQHAASAWTMNLFNGGTGGSFNSDFFDIPLVTSSWYHVVMADDFTTVRFYVNGVLRASQDRKAFGFVPNGTNGDPATGGAMVLGHRGDTAFLPFDGSIDEVAVYNYALSARQAQLHYLNSASIGIAQSGGNIILTWPFGTLQVATQAGGEYTPVPGATSPYTNAVTAPQNYFRVQVSP